MGKKIIKFDDTGIEKRIFYQHKSHFWIDNIDISKIVVSDKVCLGKKYFEYFISYKDAKKTRLLCIFLPECI